MMTRPALLGYKGETRPALGVEDVLVGGWFGLNKYIAEGLREINISNLYRKMNR